MSHIGHFRLRFLAQDAQCLREPHDFLSGDEAYDKPRLLGLFCPTRSLTSRFELHQHEPRMIEKYRPAAVSPMPRALRSKSFTPSSNSSARICRLSDGCAVCSRSSAALLKRPSSATAIK